MLNQLKIAYTKKALEIFGSIKGRDIVDVNDTDFTDIASVVLR